MTMDANNPGPTPPKAGSRNARAVILLLRESEIGPRGLAGAQEHQGGSYAGQWQPPQGLDQAGLVGQPTGDDRPRCEPEKIVGQSQCRKGGSMDRGGRKAGNHRTCRTRRAGGKEDG